jgi:hypothetical protein
MPVGYSENGAAQSANRLLKDAKVDARVAILAPPAGGNGAWPGRTKDSKYTKAKVNPTGMPWMRSSVEK